jgi:hypothetical protein
MLVKAVKSYRDLEVWQKGVDTGGAVYAIRLAISLRLSASAWLPKSSDRLCPSQQTSQKDGAGAPLTSLCGFSK